MAQSGIFRWKMSASLEGQQAFLIDLLRRADPEARREALLKASKFIRIEATRLVPRETGELQREIQILDEGADQITVGVPAGSPAIDKAWATEFGTWNYSVGTPGAPKTDWQAKSKPTAAMPWLRTGLLVARPRILRFLRRYFITGKRGRTDDS